MDVVVVDYGVSNLCSVVRALDYLGYEALLTGRPEDLRQAPRILLPGQGAFATAMLNLQTSRLVEALQEQWKIGKPIMGICVGMQIMARLGHENGDWPGLGWIDAECRQLIAEVNGSAESEAEEINKSVMRQTSFQQTPVKLPHVGWNELCFDPDEPLLAGLKQRDHCVYFAHSYALSLNKTDNENDSAASRQIIATSDYGGSFIAAIKKDNVFATQFHPEKSQENGLRILDNFMTWNPC